MTTRRCFYCDRPVSKGRHNGDLMETVDHIIPKSQGGAGMHHNRVIACRRCNIARMDDPAFFYLEFVMTALDDVNASRKETRRQFVLWMLDRGVHQHAYQQKTRDAKLVRRVMAERQEAAE